MEEVDLCATSVLEYQPDPDSFDNLIAFCAGALKYVTVWAVVERTVQIVERTVQIRLYDPSGVRYTYNEEGHPAILKKVWDSAFFYCQINSWVCVKFK